MFANVYMSIGGGVHIVCPGICGTYNVYTCAWHAYTREHLSGWPSPAGAKRPLQRLFPSSLWLPECAGGGGGQAGPDPCAAAASTTPPPHANGFLTACDERGVRTRDRTGTDTALPPPPSQPDPLPAPAPSQPDPVPPPAPTPAWLDPRPVSCYVSWTLRCSHQILSPLPTQICNTCGLSFTFDPQSSFKPSLFQARPCLGLELEKLR